MVTLDYSDALYSDGGTELTKEDAFNILFDDTELLFEEFETLQSAVDLPSPIRITEVRAIKVDDETFDLVVRCPDLTVGTQTTRGVSESDTYRVGVEAG